MSKLTHIARVSSLGLVLIADALIAAGTDRPKLNLIAIVTDVQAT